MRGQQLEIAPACPHSDSFSSQTSPSPMAWENRTFAVMARSTQRSGSPHSLGTLFPGAHFTRTCALSRYPQEHPSHGCCSVCQARQEGAPSFCISVKSLRSYPRQIVAIGRNYVDHVKELNNKVPKEPFFFLKPTSSYLPSGGRLEIPRGILAHHEGIPSAHFPPLTQF